jgi:predicted N-acetyltransferase YhbS
MHEALDRAEAGGHRAIILVADPQYYQRFGFDGTLTEQLELPGPVECHRFLGLELNSGALAGAKGRVTAAGRLGRRLWVGAPWTRTALPATACCRLMKGGR